MTWKCEQGCTGMCEHLEALLPKMSGQSVHAYPRSDLIERTTKDIFEPRKGEEERLFAILKEAAINPFDRELITLRMFEGLSFRDIAKRVGFTSEHTASYYYRKVKRILKERLDRDALVEVDGNGS